MITNFPNRNKRAAGGFSLVEVVLALSIMGFACVTLIGLIATGLTSLQKSNATTVQSQIIQEIINNSQVHTYTASYTGTTLFFDDEGTAVTTSGSATYTATLSATQLFTPQSSGTNVSYATADTQILQVQIKNKSNPNTTGSFTLVWPNTGN